MKTYRIGIVGAGFGVSAHLPALLAHPRFDVVALASPSSAKRIAEERGIPHAFTSCHAMLHGCELDAVTIASPPFAHQKDVLDTIAAGKHLVCEKPFALDVAGARAMFEASKRSAVATGLAHEFRFVPEITALHQLVVNGHLDPVRNIELTYLRHMLHREGRRGRGWWFDRTRGGGIAGAILSHIIDSSTWLAGHPPERSTGLLRTANPTRQDDEGEFESTVDDGAFALVDYGRGIIGRLSADATPLAESYTCAVHGERRSAVASGPSMIELTLYTMDDDETNELQCKPSPYARYASIGANVPYLMELYDEFVKKIEGEANGLPSFEQAVATQEVLESIGFSVTASAT
jgi:predicted dehydrogenase